MALALLWLIALAIADDSYCLTTSGSSCSNCALKSYPNSITDSAALSKCTVPGSVAYKDPRCEDSNVLFPDCDCKIKTDGQCDASCNSVNGGKCSWCAEGYYYSPADNKCLALGSKMCMYVNSDMECISCPNSNYELNTINHSCDAKDLRCLNFNKDGTCARCMKGYALTSSKTCERNGDSNRLVCVDSHKTTSDATCKACLPGYYLTSSKQCAKCGTNYMKMECTETPVAMCSCNQKCELQNNKCVESHCLYYNEYRVCYRCEEGYALNSNNNCVQTSSTACQQGWYSENGKCTQCPENCIKCLNSEFCTARVYESITTDGTKACAQESCAECSDSDPAMCVRCKDGYTFNNWKCISQAKEYVSDLNYFMIYNYLIDGLTRVPPVSEGASFTNVPHLHKPKFITGDTCTEANRDLKHGCTCKKGYYAKNEDVDGECGQCDVSCLACSSSERCYECDETMELSSEFERACVCRKGYFAKTDSKNSCNKCAEFCVDCTSETACTQCSGENRDRTKGCQCTKGYADPGDIGYETRSCYKIPEGCLKEGNYQWDQTNEVYVCTKCDDDKRDYADSCQSCMTGYYMLNNDCVECEAGCAACTNGMNGLECDMCKNSDLDASTHCTECNDYNHLQKIEGVDSPCDNQLYNDKCYQCVPNTIPGCLRVVADNPDQCRKCDVEVASNFNTATCTCNEGFMLVTQSNGNVECAPCSTLNDDCSKCSTTRQSIGKYVSPVCEACQNDNFTPESACQKCKDTGKYIDGDDCKDCRSICKTCRDGESCQTCVDEDMTGSLCDTCVNGKYKKDGACVKCPDNCASCSDAETCEVCISSIPNLAVANHCESCVSGYYYHADAATGVKECVLCASSIDQCDTCELDGDNLKCTLCAGDNVNPTPTSDGKCTCAAGFYDVSEDPSKVVCVACGKGYNDIEPRFSQWCTLCTTTDCLECSDPMTHPDGPDCACNSGTFETDYGICVPCNFELEGCDECDLNGTQCSKCDGEHELQGGKCVSGAPFVLVLLCLLFLVLV